jgi:pyridoxal phosphate enzyme (YggS family)
MTPGTPSAEERAPQNGDDAAPDVAGRLAAVRAHIDEVAAAAGRDGAAVTLVAVSKMQPAERVAAAISAGHRVFGENRVQEAAAKYPGLKESCPDLSLHLIGPLQTNKARDAVRLFDVIESLDRPKLARALAKEMAREGRRPICFIQVNTGEEPQKTGVFPAETDDLIALARDELELPVEGLMCIPPIDEEPALHFALLREIARRNGLPLLSMGMTADFETAIRFGATHVRIGTGVFGPRSKPDDAQPAP